LSIAYSTFGEHANSPNSFAFSIDRYLKWVDDPRHREAALNCAAARRLDKDVVAAVMGNQDADELFDWLAEMPFVQTRPSYWEYHPKVRKLMLAFSRHRSLRDTHAIHRKLRSHYRALLQEKSGDDEPRYRDTAWSRYTLESLYHGLMQESAAAEREGLETFLLALRGYYPLAGALVMTWRQAAEEQESANQVTEWANLLSAAWAAIEGETMDAALLFYEALRKKDLSGAAQSELYFIGGLIYSALEDYERAIADYDRAIELNPEDAAAHYNRGNAYADLEDYERAIADYDRAIELNPELAQAHSNRGSAYAALEDYERAIADYDRAIELNPELAQAHSNRGLAYADLEDYERAIADYDRAIELNPEDAGARFNKACAYALLKKVPQACDWLQKAITLDPQYRQLAQTDTDFDPIRDDPAFQALIEKNSPK